jgi:hypothetical protein
MHIPSVNKKALFSEEFQNLEIRVIRGKRHCLRITFTCEGRQGSFFRE